MLTSDFHYVKCTASSSHQYSCGVWVVAVKEKKIHKSRGSGLHMYGTTIHDRVAAVRVHLVCKALHEIVHAHGSTLSQKKYIILVDSSRDQQRRR